MRVLCKTASVFGWSDVTPANPAPFTHLPRTLFFHPHFCCSHTTSSGRHSSCRPSSHLWTGKTGRVGQRLGMFWWVKCLYAALEPLCHVIKLSLMPAT